MPFFNQVAVTVTDEETTKVREALATLNSTLRPKLVQLNAQSRMELPKMGDKSFGFVNKTLDYAGTNPDFAPRYFNLEDAKTDFAAVAVLREFAGSLSTLAEMVNDTMTLSGSEAYAASLSFYNAVKSAAKDNQPGAKLIYDDLRARFLHATASDEVTETVAAK